MQKYISLEDTDYKWIFDKPTVSKSDLERLLPFSEKYGSRFWTENICAERHLMLCNDLEQRFTFRKVDCFWDDYWNKNQPEEFAALLREHIDLPANETVVFFWSRNSGLETTWGVFLRNWINFLYEDEAPILLCPQTGESIMFGPNGYMAIGRKSSEGV
jgi:hypothetical protein